MREIDVEYVTNQKKQPGKYISIGGAELAATFLRFNLIDEFRLYIAPIILGGGKHMFHPQEHQFNLKFV